MFSLVSLGITTVTTALAAVDCDSVLVTMGYYFLVNDESLYDLYSMFIWFLFLGLIYLLLGYTSMNPSSELSLFSMVGQLLDFWGISSSDWCTLLAVENYK